MIIVIAKVVACILGLAASAVLFTLFYNYLMSIRFEAEKLSDIGTFKKRSHALYVKFYLSIAAVIIGSCIVITLL